MSRKTLSVGIVAVLVATFLSVLYVPPAEACASCGGCGGCSFPLTQTCTTVTFSLPGVSDINYFIGLEDQDFNDLGLLYSGDVSGDGPLTFPYSIPAGDHLIVYAYDSAVTLQGQYILDPVPCTSANAVTWFTPNDSRINGHPGDQIAVYCNKATATSPANIDVWGIINSDGFSLTKVNVSDIAKSGAAFKDGKGGTVFLGGSGGYFFAAWVNGAFGANGQNSFGKTFSCTF